MIKVGDGLPEATLNELTVEYTQGCPTGPEAYKVSDLARGKCSSAEKMLEQL